MNTLKIADTWFYRQTVDDKITLFREPHVHPLLRCNVWHVQGRDRDLLVDTGLGIQSLKAAAKDLFGKPITVVVTHFHNDHVGGLHEFQSDHCAVHELEAEELKNGADGMALTLQQLGPEMVALFTAAGYELDDECLLDALPCDGFDPSSHRLVPVNPHVTLAEGDVVDLGDRAFEVLHLPGHSPGSIGLWEASTKTLFAGDAIYDGPLLCNLPQSDAEAYTRTMERLEQLPAKQVLAGHGEPFGLETMKAIARGFLEMRA